MVIAVVVIPIRVIVIARGRAYWSDRWRAATRWRRGFAVAGFGFLAIAACEWLALWVLVLIKISDHRFLGGSGQAGLMFFIVIALVGITMFVAHAVGELLLLPLRSTPQADEPYGQAAATSAGSTTPAGPRSA